MSNTKLTNPKGLNELQLHLLEMFSIDIPKKELGNLKKLLMSFYDNLAKDEMAKIWKSKKMNGKTIEDIDKTHRRTAYK